MNGDTISRGERSEVVLLVDEPQVSITWSRYAPGERGPDLHVHREHTDAFYVLEGELTFLVGPGGERVAVSAGGFVAVPPNLAHSFLNDSDAEARWLNFHAPDQGFAAYMRGLRDGNGPAFDSFDPPADGGLPADTAIVSRAGEGERLDSVLLKAAMRDLCVCERELAAPRPDHAAGHVDYFYELEGERQLHIRTPDGGFADFLRQGDRG